LIMTAPAWHTAVDVFCLLSEAGNATFAGVDSDETYRPRRALP
jgi:hypothetical protein